MIAFSLNGEPGPEYRDRKDERVFMQDFLRFYTTEVIPHHPFHYETFYDYYMGYLRKGSNKKQIQDFCEDFDRKYGWNVTVDSNARIRAFNRSYSQLIANLLRKQVFLDDNASTIYPEYGNFIRFLREALESNDVKFHTLNHDLLFEYLCKNHLDSQMTDGFSLWGSPFYAMLSVKHLGIHKYFQVKMNHFCDCYDKPLCYYKLHGSIDNLIFLRNDNKRIRV